MDEPNPTSEQVHEAVSALRDAIANLGQFLHDEGSMLTTWHLVCEWMDADGDYWLTSHTDAGTPPWRVNGLLNAVLSGDTNMVIVGADPEDDD